MAVTEGMAQESHDLHRRLRLRHLIMLSVGGTIASGFFLFIGQAIGIAGPAVVITFAIVGIVSLAVMACLAELSVNSPVAAVAGSFAIYVRDTMGALGGFLTGWNYWLAWVMGAATESVAAGTYFHTFRPEIPIWIVAGIIVAIEMVVNLVGVLFMGEYEFTLSMIKTIVLALFVLVGIAAILGIGFHATGVSAYTAHGGFAPKGFGAVFAALFTVFFAYVGIELVGIGAEETVHPERDVPRALMWTAALVAALFVVGSMVLMAIVPWTRAATTSISPFVDALNALHVPVIATIFNWVVIIASLSSVDGGLYTASRMLFALAREGYFPATMARTQAERKVPTPSILITSLCIFVGAVLAFFNPGNAYVFVASLSSFGFLYAWLMIPLAQVLYRRQRGESYVRALHWRVPLYPLTPLVAIVAVLVAFGGQFFFGSGTSIGPITIPGSGLTVVVGIVWTIVWALYYLAIGRTFTHGEAWRAGQDRPAPAVE
ncbi:MAG TPA: amino acid permease [Chloroflexota bacterium]|nr:amino acid permease [Chloroflexota bacterium]